MELAWARYQNPSHGNAVNTKLFVEIDPNDARSSDGRVSLEDLDNDTRVVAVHDGPWGLIIERRTLGNTRNGVGIDVATIAHTNLKRWVTILGPGSQGEGLNETMEGNFMELELVDKADSGAEGSIREGDSS